MGRTDHDHALLGGTSRMLTLREAAARLGTSYRSLNNHYAEWGVPTIKVGRRVKVPERRLDLWIERRVRAGGES